jgi:hypothetical protein
MRCTINWIKFAQLATLSDGLCSCDPERKMLETARSPLDARKKPPGVTAVPKTMENALPVLLPSSPPYQY